MWISSLPQGWPLVPATGLCHFTSLALVLLALLAALAQVDTKKMVRVQCGVCPRAYCSICFPLLPRLSHCLQSPQVGMGCPLSHLIQATQVPSGGEGAWEESGVLSPRSLDFRNPVEGCPWVCMSLCVSAVWECEQGSVSGYMGSVSGVQGPVLIGPIQGP